MNEKEKYIEMYAGETGKAHADRHNNGGYGRGFFGENAIPFIRRVTPKSVCDVGCGYGRFCNAISDFVDVVYGIDIASVATGNVIPNQKINYIDSHAKNIPLENNAVEWITSFDCLEHCLPEDIDTILKEFDRIATKGFIFSISYEQCWDHGLKLHMTVRPEEWWVEKLKEYGEVSLGDHVAPEVIPTRYIIVNK
jgi:ubiquinone/menaquinone biosynthesis C-methylase UbiE